MSKSAKTHPVFDIINKTGGSHAKNSKNRAAGRGKRRGKLTIQRLSTDTGK
jgi:hypothetical protein